MNKLLAPNGKPSNLTPEQYKLVRTPAFKEWFGDWENDPANASKVIDENGEPLVCNHSSREENIYIFYGGRIFRTKKNEVKPIWFTYKQFNEYASGDDIFQYQCFLKIKNLFDYSKIEDVNILKKSYIEKNGEMLPDYDFDMDWDAQEQFNLPAYIFEIGYDGYKFTDEYSIVVFESNQIKLADGTNTTFDGNNPDIRFDGGGSVSNYREFWDNLKIENGSKYIGQKFADVFPFIGKRTSPSQFRISIKEYNKLLGRLEKDNYTTKGLKTADLNRLEKIEKYIDKRKYLSRFYLDPRGTIISFDNSDNDYADGGDISKYKEFIGSWEQLKKENPNLWETGILRRSLNPQGATDIIPKDVHIRQGQWQNYGQYDEIEAETIYGKPDSYGYYNDEDGNPIIDERTGNYLKDEFDYENNAERIKATISNKQLKSNLIDSFETEQGKEYLKKVIATLPKNEDGTITAYRIGTIDEGIQSYTLSEGMAKTFSNQGTDIMPSGLPSIPNEGYKEYGVLPVNNVKINPKGIVAWSPYDSEILVESKYVKTYKNNEERLEIINKISEKDKSIKFKEVGLIQPRDLTQIENYRNIYKGAEFYSFSDDNEKQERADRWFELFRTNQKQRQLTEDEFYEFMELSNELSWEEFANGGNTDWDAERYREVEKQMYELRKQKKVDSAEYFKLIKERSILEKNKSKKINIKDMEYGKGGKVNMLPADTQKFGRIGVTDKYVIEATKDVGLQGINFDSNSILKRIDAGFQAMLENYKSYLISKDSQSITNYINNEIETHKEQGSSLETIQRLEAKKTNQSEREGIIRDIAKTQEETLIQWVTYLKQSEYPVPFKFLMLKAVFEYNYDIKQNKLFERGEETIRNFTPFDAGTLAELYAKQSDYLLMEYNVILNENANKIFNSKEIISESGNGKWIKFNGGKKTKPEDIAKNGKELMQLVQNTYWCTKSAGTSQLRGGDFYVYVTESNGEVYPRIAVRMNENEVGEVRGNRSSAQDLDEEMLPIAEDFLVKNIPNNSGKKWLDSIKYNRRCVALKNRFESEGMFKDSIYEYMQLIAGEINVNYGTNGNVANLIQAFKDAKNKLPNDYYKKDEIEDDYNFLSPNTRYFIGDLGRYELRTYRERYNIELTDLSDWKLQLVSGFVMLQDTNVTSLGNLEFVGKTLTLSPTITDLGRLNYVGEELQFNNSPINSLKNLETIGGGLVVTSKIKDLGKLKKIGFLKIESSDDNFTLGSLEHIEGDLEILNSSVDIDFGNLKTIGGSLIAKNSQTQDLKNLESVGGDFIIAGSKIKKFEKLKSIGGNADFSNNFCSSTQNIEIILGDIKFLNSRITQFPNLIRVGGTIEFRGSYFTSFGNIKNIGGNLNLLDSKLLDLGELEAVGGYISFKGSKVKSLGKLKKVTQFAHFELSEVEDLGDLEIIGGNAYFQNSKIKSLGKLKYIGGLVVQFGNNKQLQEQWEKIKNG